MVVKDMILKVNEKPFTLPLVKSIIKACRTSHVFVKNDELSATPQSKTMKVEYFRLRIL